MTSGRFRQLRRGSEVFLEMLGERSALCLVLLGALLAYLAICRCGDRVSFEILGQKAPSRRGQIEHRLDPNTAGWAELATLPRIGEVLGKRIVAYREEQQAFPAGGGEPPRVFSSLEDLEAVRGIGPKTLGRLQGHLKFADCRPADGI